MHMDTYQVITLMIAFGSLIVMIMSDRRK
ncbi:putative holin-like toxin [Longirhabdus pacifica]